MQQCGTWIRSTMCVCAKYSHIVLLAGGPYSGLSRSTIHNHVVSELGAPYAEQNKASFGEVHCLRLTLSNHYMKQEGLLKKCLLLSNCRYLVKLYYTAQWGALHAAMWRNQHPRQQPLALLQIGVSALTRGSLSVSDRISKNFLHPCGCNSPESCYGDNPCSQVFPICLASIHCHY